MICWSRWMMFTIGTLPGNRFFIKKDDFVGESILPGVFSRRCAAKSVFRRRRLDRSSRRRNWQLALGFGLVLPHDYDDYD